MIQMQGNGNINIQILQHSVYHTNDYIKTTHVFAGTLGYTQDNRGTKLLSGEQNGLCPLQVVDVELTYCIVTCFCFFEHFCCGY